jgi:hypothetical protein
MKTLVMGWFSFEMYGATAGDLMARDVICDWLRDAGHEFDVALAAPFTGGVDWRTVDPFGYTHLLFVCGPFGDHDVTREFLQRFGHCRKIGVNLSMLDSLDLWNPFHLLIERDSSRANHPDFSLLCEQTKPPVAGLLLVHKQEEYRKRGRHQQANDAVHRLIAANEMAVVDIDTRLDENRTGLRTSGEVEALISRMDLVLTTRLHGMVLAIKNGVPAVVVDAIAGGAKVTRQAESLGWPVCLAADTLTDTELQQAYEYCRTAEARGKAGECAANARAKLLQLRASFIADDNIRSANT